MTDLSKGAVLGCSNLVAIAICLFVERDAVVVPAHVEAVIWLGISAGVVAGVMLGAVGLHDQPRRVRAALLVVLALLLLAVVAPLWPELMPIAIPITALHALLLARWTARAPIAGAVARGRR